MQPVGRRSPWFHRSLSAAVLLVGALSAAPVSAGDAGEAPPIPPALWPGDDPGWLVVVPAPDGVLPDGAIVFLDGEPIAVVPMDGPVEVPPGPHEVVVTALHHEPGEGRVLVHPGETTTLTVDLRHLIEPTCAGVLCSGHGRCKSTYHTIWCACEPGWTSSPSGLDCVPDADLASRVRKLAGGSAAMNLVGLTALSLLGALSPVVGPFFPGAFVTPVATGGVVAGLPLSLDAWEQARRLEGLPGQDGTYHTVKGIVVASLVVATMCVPFVAMNPGPVLAVLWTNLVLGGTTSLALAYRSRFVLSGAAGS